MSIKAIRLKPEQATKVRELAGRTTELNEAAILRMSISAGLPRVEKLINELPDTAPADTTPKQDSANSKA